MGWLVAQGNLVEVIAENAEREDGHGEQIAAITAVATGELGEDAIVVLWCMLGRRRVLNVVEVKSRGYAPWRATVLGNR